MIYLFLLIPILFAVILSLLSVNSPLSDVDTPDAVDRILQEQGYD